MRKPLYFTLIIGFVLLIIQQPVLGYFQNTGQVPEVSCTIPEPFIAQSPNLASGFTSDETCDFLIGVTSESTEALDDFDVKCFVADDFIAPQSGILSHVCFAGYYFNFNSGPLVENQPQNAGIPDDFSIVFFNNDNGGLPGSVHAGPYQIGLPTVKQLTGDVISGSGEPIYHYELNFPEVVVAAGQTYFVSIYNNIPGIDWNWATGGFNPENAAINGLFIETVFPALPETAGFLDTWQRINDQNAAFALGYAEIFPIPTLGQWGVITLCLLLIISGVIFRYSHHKSPAI